MRKIFFVLLSLVSANFANAKTSSQSEGEMLASNENFLQFIKLVESTAPFKLARVEKILKLKWHTIDKQPYFSLYEGASIDPKYQSFLRKVALQLPAKNANFNSGVDIQLKDDAKITLQSMYKAIPETQFIPEPPTHADGMVHHFVNRPYGRMHVVSDKGGVVVTVKFSRPVGRP